MNAARSAVVTLTALVIVLFGSRSVQVQQLPQVERDKAEGYSPLGFEDLRAHEQAFPGNPNSLEVFRASAGKYWIFRGVAYRGGEPRGNAWASLGPLSTTEGGASGTGSFSGRVSALAISPTCTINGPCRLWVGAAGGGVWRTDEGMRTDDLGWRWIGHGLGTNSIGSLALDPNDDSGDTIYVGTGETNSPQNSGAGTGLYRSTDGGDHWTRVGTNILDTAVSPAPIDFTSTRGIGSVAIDPGNPRIIYVGTTTAMLGMTAVRGGQSQVTGYPQPRLGLYKTTDAGATWTLIWTPPLAPVVPPNPNATPGQGDTMIGVRSIKLDPRDPHIVYVSAWNNAIHRVAAKFEGGDTAFKPVFAMPDASRFQDLAMFDLTEYRGHTRIYVYNGTLNGSGQQLFRLDNADVAAAKLVSGSGANLVNSGEWQALTSTDPAEVGSVSFNICGSQCFYDLVVAVPPQPSRHGGDRRRAEQPLAPTPSGRPTAVARSSRCPATRRRSRAAATLTCGPSCSTRAIPTLSSSAATAASCATTARSAISRAAAPASSHCWPPAAPCCPNRRTRSSSSTAACRRCSSTTSRRTLARRCSA